MSNTQERRKREMVGYILHMTCFLNYLNVGADEDTVNSRRGIARIIFMVHIKRSY